MRNLALFDLDQTLIPTDSDYEWGRFMVRLGLVDAEQFACANECFYADYQAGRLDVQAYLRFILAPLARHSREQLNRWHAQFMREVIEPVLRPKARALVQRHLASDDLCCLVTATNAFVTAPIATAFGIPHLIASELATEKGQPHGCYTGEIAGIPSFREGKVARTEAWLKQLNQNWSSFSHSYFYSDSHNDIPLLEKVTDPIATNPDDALRNHAQLKGWRILNLF